MNITILKNKCHCHCHCWISKLFYTHWIYDLEFHRDPLGLCLRRVNSSQSIRGSLIKIIQYANIDKNKNEPARLNCMRKGINITEEDRVVYVDRFWDRGEGRAGAKQVRNAVLSLDCTLHSPGDLCKVPVPRSISETLVKLVCSMSWAIGIYFIVKMKSFV